MKLQIRPITFRKASEYVNQYHRHHRATVGCKFCLSVYEDDRLCGVAVAGRPVSRALDDGTTLEINRVCTDGTRNACSKLYGACVRVAKEMGYKKVVTYILESEDGASVKAANFKCEGTAGSEFWRGNRSSGKNLPKEKKQRYVYIITK